jgi:3-hydroxyisobutyrate dehydrogenase-like beta-hydroxyacid dehydrogenase
LWLQFGRVIDLAGIVAEKIRAAYGVPLVKVVIELPHRIVRVHVIGESGGNSGGTSGIGPKVGRESAAKVRERGADMVDSPMSGSVITLQQGKLSVMVGGSRESFERVRPLLEDIGPKVTYVGENGLALAMKIATNLSLAVQMLAFSEGVLLAEKSGIARETEVDVLTHSAVASPMIQYRGPILSG